MKQRNLSHLFFLCGQVPNDLRTGSGPQPGGWGPLSQMTCTNPLAPRWQALSPSLNKYTVQSALVLLPPFMYNLLLLLSLPFTLSLILIPRV